MVAGNHPRRYVERRVQNVLNGDWSQTDLVYDFNQVFCLSSTNRERIYNLMDEYAEGWIDWYPLINELEKIVTNLRQHLEYV